MTKTLNKTKTIIIPSPPLQSEGIKSSCYAICDKIAKEGYDLCLTEAATILDCSSRWIHRNILNSVSNIILNSKIKYAFHFYKFHEQYMDEHNLSLEQRTRLINTLENKGLYFFNRKEFYSFIEEHSKSEKHAHAYYLTSSEEIDRYSFFWNHAANKMLLELGMNNVNALNNLNKKKITQSATTAFMNTLDSNNISILIGDQQKNIYNSSMALNRSSFPLYSVPYKETSQFVSIKSIQSHFNMGQAELALRLVFQTNSIKYTICDSLVRYDAEILVLRNKTPLILMNHNDYLEYKKSKKAQLEF